MSSGKKGLFITFEGPDGVGKSTHVALLAKYLEENSISAIVTREPGGTTIGKSLREILLSVDTVGLDPMAELLIYYADRAQHISQVIAPAINNGTWVICDRFYDSSYAYQSAGHKVSPDAVDTLTSLVASGCKPDITFLLDVEGDSSAQRIALRGEAKDRMELEDNSFKARVREAFLELAQREPQRFRKIDASGSPTDTFAQIISQIKPFL